MPRTYTFACTFSQLRKITCFVCRYLRAYATHLKSAGLYRPWGFKSPSGHHIINNLQDICENRRLRNLALVILLVILCT
jgi:hypothetical protein